LIELETESFKSDLFDPLHEDAIDLDLIAKSPIPANYQRATSTPVNVIEPMNAVMADLLGLK
jgi:hypothetical protein